MRRAFLPYGLSPKTPLKKIIRQTQIERHSTKYLTSTSENHQGPEKQGKSEKTVGDKGDITKCNVVSWMGS